MAIRIDTVNLIKENGENLIDIKLGSDYYPKNMTEVPGWHIKVSIDMAKRIVSLLNKAIEDDDIEEARHNEYKVGAYYKVKILNKDTGLVYDRIIRYDSIGFGLRGNEEIVNGAPITEMYDAIQANYYKKVEKYL